MHVVLQNNNIIQRYYLAQIDQDNTMRIAYNSVLRWIEERAADCSLPELYALSTTLESIIERAENRSKVAAHVLAQAEAAAKTAGFTSLDALLAATGTGVVRTNPNGVKVGKQLATPRKPYLDPLDPDTAAYAVYKDREVPPAIQKRLDEGWSLEEMHYKRISAARKARQLQPNQPYDPVKKHAQLMEAEPPRYRR